MATRSTRKKLFAYAYPQRYALGSWEVQPFHSWLANSPDADRYTRRSVHWGKMLGLALTVVTGATFWTGVGLLVAHLWK
jgi:hypothetical protein